MSADLRAAVAPLQPGHRVTATVSPLHRGTYQITGVLRGGVDSELLLGGWEMVRLANGEPPVYLRSVELAGDEPAEDAAPGPRVWQVDEPALLSGIPDHTYHGGLVRTPGPQVSQSGLKMLRPPSTPREFQHYLLHGIETTSAMDKGSAAHALVLGLGQAFVRHPEDLLNAAGAMNSLKDSRAWIASEKAKGHIVLRHDDYDDVFNMAEEILAHPRAAELFTDPSGHAEVSAYHEASAGLWMRSRFDLMRHTLVDLKTTVDPHPEAWQASAWKFGYYIQDVSYRRAYMACTGDPDPGPMTFIVVGSKAPHLVGVYDLGGDFEAAANAQLDAALELYAEQLAKHGDPRDPAVRWDGLPLEKRTLTPPAWVLRDLEQTTTTETAEWLLSDLEGILQ